MRSLLNTRRVFLGGLSLCYLFAFASFLCQIPGLYGPEGLLPVATMLQRQASSLPSADTWRLVAKYPTLVWLHRPLGLPETAMLQLLAAAGVALSAQAFGTALLARAGPTKPLLLALWLLYLSAMNVGQTFLSFQWDILLLEAGFVAGMVAPSWQNLTALQYHFATQCIPTPVAWAMHRLPPLLLKLGVAFTLWLEVPATLLLLCPLRAPRIAGAALQVALQVMIVCTGNYNFFNLLTATLALACLDDRCLGFPDPSPSPSPSPSPRLAAAAPPASKQSAADHDETPASVVARRAASEAAAAEVPARTRWRMVWERASTAASWAVLGVVIASAGYMFEWDAAGTDVRLVLTTGQLDAVLERWLPLGVLGFSAVLLPGAALLHAAQGAARAPSKWAAIKCVLCTALALSAAIPLHALSAYSLTSIHPAAVSALPFSVPHAAYLTTRNYYISNPYGLFRRMTGVGSEGEVARPEIVIEGSYDGHTWAEYEFKYKPGSVARAPPWVAPHQPRLDWQMWFAALGSYQQQQNLWFVQLLWKLLEGSAPVRGLLAADGPFPASAPPPRLVRCRLYHYDFTPYGASGGAWWERREVGEYMPAISLEEAQVASVLHRVYQEGVTVHPPPEQGTLAHTLARIARQVDPHASADTYWYAVLFLCVAGSIAAWMCLRFERLVADLYIDHIEAVLNDRKDSPSKTIKAE